MQDKRRMCMARVQLIHWDKIYLMFIKSCLQYLKLFMKVLNVLKDGFLETDTVGKNSF